MKQERKVYITGVAGMIGSNTARALLKEGNTVIGIDNLWNTTQGLSDKRFIKIFNSLETTPKAIDCTVHQ